MLVFDFLVCCLKCADVFVDIDIKYLIYIYIHNIVNIMYIYIVYIQYNVFTVYNSIVLDRLHTHIVYVLIYYVQI